MSDVPPGFAPVQTKGFGGFTGPVLRGHDARGEVFIFDIAAQHLNGGDRLHGGMMMTLASVVLGEAAKSAAEKGEAGNYSVSWKSQSRSTFDRKKYEQACGAIPQEFFKTSTFRAFKITERS